MSEKEDEEIFEISWLTERYPFDVEARSKKIQAIALQALEAKPKLRLIDISAGIGSNCLYFMKQLEQNQEWLLLESRAGLKAKIIRQLKDYATFHKYDFEQKKKGIKIRSSSKIIQVQILEESFLNPVIFAKFSKADLVFANAAFKNCSSEQFRQFAQIILKEKTPCLFTLNYEGMTFDPEDPFDTAFLNMYDDYLERQQNSKQAMGKNSGATILSFFEKNNWINHSASSNWQVEQEDIKMHYYLLANLENAIETVNLDPIMQSNFSKVAPAKKRPNYHSSGND